MAQVALDEVLVEVYAAADPTAAWTFSDPVDLKHHVYVDFVPVASGTSPASYEAKLQTSCDPTAAVPVWDDVPTDEVAGGLGPHRARIFQLEDEDGTVLSGRGCPITYERKAKRWVRLAVKSTGGAGTDRLQVLASRGEV